MGQLARILATGLLLGTAAPAFAHSQPPIPNSQPPPNAAATNTSPAYMATNRVLGYTAWDDDYFYVALQINKPVLSGKNTQPFSNPLEDDAAILTLQTDDDHKATQRTAHTYSIAVSAVGGAQLYSGADAKPLFLGLNDLQARLDAIGKSNADPGAQATQRAALLGKLLKSAVVPQGGPRPGAVHAPGYTVEVAIPWADLGGRPAPGTRMGFNVAAQSVTGGSPPLQSLAPGVKGVSDLNNPSLWGEILFSNEPDVKTQGALVCPRVFAARPVIDGDLSPGEWNGLSAFDFGERLSSGGGSLSLAVTLAARVHPDFKPLAPRAAVPLPAPVTAPLAMPARHPQKVTPLVVALYDYWFQADPRKEAPAQHVLRPDGSTALAAHPLDGAGPWFSYDHADWHRRQLQDVRSAGVDVILPVYRGDARDRQLYADKGLTVLAAALQAMRRAGQDYPQVALYLETSALEQVFGDKPDLREPAVQAALYGMIRDFYRRIPAPFRCTVSLTTQNGGRPAYPVFLSGAGAFKQLDSSFVPYLRGRFAADFDGADLILLGASDFKPQAVLDGYFTETRDKGFQFDGDGWIKIASVGAGYDTTYLATAGEAPVVRPRRSGMTYRADWAAALGRHPDWVFLDGWNDYHTAADVAPTVEDGYTTADLTKIYARLFAGTARLSTKFLWHNAPSAMLAQQTYDVSVRAQNTGMTAWGPTVAPDQAPVAFAYRWLRQGQVVSTGAQTPLPGPVLAGQNLSLTLPVKTSGLAAGDYILEIGPVSLEKQDAIGTWIGDTAGGESLKIPVQITEQGTERETPNAQHPTPNAPEWAVRVLQTDLPNMLESGGVYDAQVTLRNDGATPWRKADGARVVLRLFRATAGSDGSLTETPVETADASAALPQDVAPGQQVTARLLVPLMDPEGKPLPTWKQDDLWTYTTRWEVTSDSPNAQRPTPNATREAGNASPAGADTAPMPVDVVAFDFGARFTADGTPSYLPGGRRLPVRLSLQNAGPQIWKKNEVRVGYHWYYADGTEFLWEDETTPVPQDVPPGGRVDDMLAWVTAPPYDGIYWLVWDVKVGDTWASTAASTRVYDQIVRRVQVGGGHLLMADLSKDYNLDGVTADDDLAGGDFDGQGRTFPAELLPPFADSAIAPSTMWLPAPSGPDSPRHISFLFGPKELKAKNFIVCKGQRLELGKSSGRCHILHLLAATTGKDVQTQLRLIFQEPTSQSEDLYTFAAGRWDRPPTHGEEIAFLCRRHHDRNGIQPGAVALYHYTITVHEPRKLVAIQLPNEPALKIAAITLEP